MHDTSSNVSVRVAVVGVTTVHGKGSALQAKPSASVAVTVTVWPGSIGALRRRA